MWLLGEFYNEVFKKWNGFKVLPYVKDFYKLLSKFISPPFLHCLHLLLQDNSEFLIISKINSVSQISNKVSPLY